jgi:thiol-disulfide isomerase/thioredoxin
MEHFNNNVVYLEDKDFDESGKLLPRHDKPVVIMIMASWCGHCRNLKPVFQEFANKSNGNRVYTAVIQSDGSRESERKLAQRLNKIIPGGVRGFPTIVKFENGKYRETYMGPRTLDSLVDF